MNRFLPLFLLMLFITVPGIRAQHLASLKEAYQAKIDLLDATRAEKMAEAELLAEKHFNNLLEQLRNTGNLQVFLAAEKDFNQWKAGKAIDPASHPHVKKILDAYAEELEIIARQDLRQRAPLTASYRKKLKTQIAKLTRENNIPGAKEAQAELERLPGVSAPPISQVHTTTLAKLHMLDGFGSIQSLQNGNTAYRNRNYKWINIPEDLPVTRFAIINGGSPKPITAQVEQPGWVYIASGLIEEKKGFPAEGLLKDGWTNTQASFAYTDKNKTTLHIFKKYVTAGPLTIKRNNWSGPVLLLP